jgi:hypothetical protein
MTRVAVTRAWLTEGLSWYQTTVLEWYLPLYVKDEAWQ